MLTAVKLRWTQCQPMLYRACASSLASLPAPKFPTDRPKVNYEDLSQIAMKLYSAGIEEVSSASMISKTLKYDKEKSLLQVFCNDFVLQREVHSEYKVDKNIHVVAFGKAVTGLVRAVEDLFGEHIVNALAVVPTGAIEGLRKSEKRHLLLRPNSKFKVLEGGDATVPSPDAVMAAEEISTIAKSLTSNDILICLISGGGSGLLAMPKPPITIQEKAMVTQLLDNAGAKSLEMNTVRKNLSLIKAGGLAAMASPAKVISLILSNLPHTQSTEVASGPTAPDYSTPYQALDIFRKYKIESQIPNSIMALLQKEAKDAIGMKWFSDSLSVQDIYSGPKPRHDVSNATNILAGSDEIAVGAILRQCALFEIAACAIQHKAGNSGTKSFGQMFAAVSQFVATLLTRSVRSMADPSLVLCELDCIKAGLSKKELKKVTAVAEEASCRRKPVCLVFTSEVTVEVRGSGTGGPCQEVALATAIELGRRYKKYDSLKKCDVQLFSIDTDGLDGNTPVAGAVANCHQADRVVRDQDAEQYLDDNDSYSFYAQLDEGKYQICTGLTGTDIQNFQLLLIRTKSS